MSDSAIAAIPGIESFIVTPEGFGTSLRISIARPVASGVPTIAAPALIYVTDADFCFGTVVEAARMGCQGGEVGPAIIVGVGYAEETGDYAFSQIRRGLDLYRGPKRAMEIPRVGSLQLGGADAFLAALLDTVGPEVERRVPEAAGGRRVLFGVSAGGHFAAHVLTTRPDAFAGYALMSPALIDFPPSPGDEQLVEAVRAMPKGAIPGTTTVFLSAGAREEEPGDTMAAAASIISNAYRMRSALIARGVATELKVFPDETHISSLGAAVTRALRFLVPPRTASPAKALRE